MSTPISAVRSTESLPAQHSQFDIYPEGLIRADQKLHNIQRNLSILSFRISQQRSKPNNSQKSNQQNPPDSLPLPSTSDSNIVSQQIDKMNQLSQNANRYQEIGLNINKWAVQDEIDYQKRNQNLQRTAFFYDKLRQLYQTNRLSNFFNAQPLMKKEKSKKKDKKNAQQKEKKSMINSQETQSQDCNQGNLEKYRLSIQKAFEIEIYCCKSKELDRDVYQQKATQFDAWSSKSSKQQQLDQKPRLKNDQKKLSQLLLVEIKKLIESFQYIKEWVDLQRREEGMDLIQESLLNAKSGPEIVQEDRLWKVLGRVADLNEEMKQNKASDYFRNNERVERLFDIIRSMIINFKISRKSMERIISMKQSREVNKNKYMHLKQYLQALYRILQQESAIKNDACSRSSHNLNQMAEIVLQLPTLYENHQQKVEKLSSQLSKVRMELDYKTKQFEQLKAATLNQINLTNPRRDLKIQQVENVLGDSLQTLMQELEQQKQKCLQYQSRAAKKTKKKTEKVIFIRK